MVVVVVWGLSLSAVEDDQRTREGAVSIQGTTRAPLRLRHWVHWHVWVLKKGGGKRGHCQFWSSWFVFHYLFACVSVG